MVLNGVEWTLGNQLRLRPGVFVRKTHAGEFEAHVNVAPGTGSTHHYAIDPKTKVFKVRVGQSNIPLAPLLRRMGRPTRTANSSRTSTGRAFRSPRPRRKLSNG
jgi:hypothetical protein